MPIEVKRSQPIQIPTQLKSSNNFNPSNNSPNKFINKLEEDIKNIIIICLQF